MLEGLREDRAYLLNQGIRPFYKSIQNLLTILSTERNKIKFVFLEISLWQYWNVV
jgi:hypothetical protein